VDPNPAFDSFRALPLTGWVYGDSVYNQLGVSIPGQFCFDLPDTDFLFPGDELHYYISAGVGAPHFHYASLPPDTTDFSLFGLESTYPPAFTVRALPSLEVTGSSSPYIFKTPPVLWVDDGGESGHRTRWEISLRNLGMVEGVDVDIFRARSPSAGLGNGLAACATINHVARYETILYSSGTLAGFTLAVDNPARDPGNDYQLLHSWMLMNDKSLLLSGDNLAADLHAGGGMGPTFLGTWMKVGFQGRDVKSDIHSQNTPVIAPLAGNPVFDDDARWAILGNCNQPFAREFDSVVTVHPGQRLAEFLNPGGTGGSYLQSAVTLAYEPAVNGNVISLPYDLSAIIMTDSYTPPSGSMRTYVLGKILLYFGNTGSGLPTHVPNRTAFRLHTVAPNPFNPTTEIHFELGTETRAEIKIYDLMGRLVKVLVDEVRPPGPDSVAWDGTDRTGRKVAAGVYFVRAVSGGRTEVRKIALVK
jgi:hypothetical protein